MIVLQEQISILKSFPRTTETRFDVLFQFNRDFLSCASLIDHSQVEKKFSLAFKISSCRKLLLAQTKEKFFKQGFSATETVSS